MEVSMLQAPFTVSVVVVLAVAVAVEYIAIGVVVHFIEPLMALEQFADHIQPGLGQRTLATLNLGSGLQQNAPLVRRKRGCIRHGQQHARGGHWVDWKALNSCNPPNAPEPIKPAPARPGSRFDGAGIFNRARVLGGTRVFRSTRIL